MAGSAGHEAAEDQTYIPEWGGAPQPLGWTKINQGSYRRRSLGWAGVHSAPWFREAIQGHHIGLPQQLCSGLPAGSEESPVTDCQLRGCLGGTSLPLPKSRGAGKISSRTEVGIRKGFLRSLRQDMQGVWMPLLDPQKGGRDSSHKCQPPLHPQGRSSPGCPGCPPFPAARHPLNTHCAASEGQEPACSVLLKVSRQVEILFPSSCDLSR